MLTRLIINNFIIIDTIDINLNKGLNIFIGETGAGKSIIIDAIMLLFGDKASPNLIRQGAKKAIVEAYFSLQNDSFILNKLKEANFDIEDNELIIRREISIKGNSRCFINDTPVTLSMLKEYSNTIVDFHGQNSQQKLFNVNNQLLILDSLVDNKTIKNEIYNEYIKIQELLFKFNTLISNKQNILNQQSLWKEQLKDIISVSPKLDEDKTLYNELKLLENAEYLFSISNNVLNLLDSYDDSAYAKFVEAKKILIELNNVDSSFKTYIEEFNSALITINETLKFVKDYCDNIEFNSIKIDKIRNRLQQLSKLKNKYGEISEILELKKNLEEKLYSVENFDIEIKKIDIKIQEVKSVLANLVLSLHKERVKAAKFLEEKVLNKLDELCINDAIFKIKFNREVVTYEDFISNRNVIIYDSESKEYIKVNSNGMDTIEFYLSTNKGIPAAPIIDIASGGEISRVMLALKSVIAEADNTPILIFDEIDTGISGRVAQKVGIVMRELSHYHQILSVTHLPQIAALGDQCIVISKSEINNIITTSAKLLNYNDKVKEIAKLLSGEQLSISSIESAKELINI